MMMRRTATFSPDRKHRFELWRVWDESKPFLMVIGLNPSVADEFTDDPTVKKCCKFALRWGYGGLLMANLFSYCATDPDVMKAAEQPQDPDNILTLLRQCGRAGLVLAAWGNHGAYLDLAKDLLPLLRANANLHCLGLTKKGFPIHPLYIPGGRRPQLYLPCLYPGPFARLTHEHGLWSDATFGKDYPVEMVLRHMLKEIEEAKATPQDPHEWADILMLALDGYRRAFRNYGRDQDFLAAAFSKFEIVKKRRYQIGPDGTGQHVANEQEPPH